MIQQTIYHEPKSKYAYAYDEKTLHIRLRIGSNEAKKITLLAFDPFNWKPDKNNKDRWVFDEDSIIKMEMIKEHSDKYIDYWFGTIDKIPSLRVRYGFYVETEQKNYFYGSHGVDEIQDFNSINYDLGKFFVFPCINKADIYKAPKWIENTVWYQILPERFCNGDKTNDPNNTLPWASTSKVNNNTFFGGDLQGIIDKLDYLKQLGINGIYLTPIFISSSSHKYDTTDYMNVDPALGGNEVFEELVKEAHKRDIKIMLDAVFNHCGWEHPFWQDVIKNGRSSKYYDCFCIDRDPVINFPIVNGKPSGINYEKMHSLNYKTFAYVADMPKWNTGNKIAREYLINVGKYWVEKYNIDGWRLDVSNEVSHDFWREFRREIKSINSDVYITGENWDNSYPWLQGDQFDAVMNYELLYTIWNFVNNKADKSNKTDALQFKDDLEKYFISYPKYLYKYMFNMIDSHDTERILDICGFNIKIAKLAYVLQMIMPGCPSIYYGGEVGLTGVEEGNRKCMIWNEDPEQHEIFKHLQYLINLRKDNPSMRSDKFKWISIDKKNNSFVLKKLSNDGNLYLLLNNSDHTVQFNNPINPIEKINLESYDYKIIFE